MEGLSVDVEALILAAGLNPKEFVVTPAYTGAVFFQAQSVRDLMLWIGYDPVSDGNQFHAQVWPQVPTRKFTDAQKSGLANLATWYVEIPDVEIK
jgi:hypothetical protein